MVTKNGLSKVEMESPILAPPPPPPPPPRWHPRATIKTATTSTTIRMVVILLLMLLLSLSASQGVGHHGEGDHGSYDHLLPERGDVKQVQAVSQDPEDERPDQGPRGAAHPTRETRAPDHHGRYGVELVGETRLGAGRGQTGRQKDAGNAGEEPRESVDEQLLAGDVYPREPRGLLVPSDGVHTPASVGTAQNPDSEGPDHEHQDHRQRYEAEEIPAAQSTDRRGYRAQRLAVGDHQRQPPSRAEHRQRRDERRQVGQGDEQAVCQPRQGTGQRKVRHRGRPAEHYAGEPQNAPDREVDAARDYNESLSEGQNGDHGYLGPHVEQVVEGEEVRGEYRHHHAEQDQAAERPAARKQLARPEPLCHTSQRRPRSPVWPAP